MMPLWSWENIERLMHEEHLDAQAAALKSMKEISGALIGITSGLNCCIYSHGIFLQYDGVDLSSVFHHVGRGNATFFIGGTYHHPYICSATAKA